MFAITFRGGAIWWTLTKARQASCNLQANLCDLCLSALRLKRCIKALYKYCSFPFLSVYCSNQCKPLHATIWVTSQYIRLYLTKLCIFGDLDSAYIMFYCTFYLYSACIFGTTSTWCCQEITYIRSEVYRHLAWSAWQHRLRNCGLSNAIYLVEEYGSMEHFKIPEETLNQAIINTQVLVVSA